MQGHIHLSPGDVKDNLWVICLHLCLKYFWWLENCSKFLILKKEQNAPLYFFLGFFICVGDTCLKEIYTWQLWLECTDLSLNTHSKICCLFKEKQKVEEIQKKYMYGKLKTWKLFPFWNFKPINCLFCRENMGMYVCFKPIWEQSPLVEPLPRTSISVCACACIHKNQISSQFLLWEKCEGLSD